jgi:uncharacterized protein
MGQTWEDLLFAHWRVPESVLRAQVPDGLDVETHDGAAWLGVTPFRVSGLRLRGMLPLPRLSSFFELNVRTYVVRDDRPGIWFFSLDASSRLAVEAARRIYRLPYFRARIAARPARGGITYDCARIEEPGRAFSGRYAPADGPVEPRPGTLEHFLTERYCLYARDETGLYRADIHHEPWPLQVAEAEIELNTMPPEGVELPDEQPVLHFSRRQDVVIWPLERVRD